MSLDISGLSGEARRSFSELGKGFGSGKTLAQANQSLKALTRYDQELAAHGFVAKDVQRLEGARDAVQAASSGREEEKVQSKGLTVEQHQQVRLGYQEREQARVMIEGVEEDLRWEGRAADEVSATLSVTLAQSKVKPSTPALLADQLEGLAGALGAPSLAEAVQGREGEGLVQALRARVESLRALSQERAQPAGTLAESERMDVLDGVIVSLVRRARKAAKSAAKATGNRAIEAAFALDALYQ